MTAEVRRLLAEYNQAQALERQAWRDRHAACPEANESILACQEAAFRARRDLLALHGLPPHSPLTVAEVAARPLGERVAA